MVREEDFYPSFGDIVLGKTTVAEAWDTPGALAGECGNPPEYFERSTASSAEPWVRALGFKQIDQVDETDVGLLCDAGAKLAECKGGLSGDAELSEEAVDCFLETRVGDTEIDTDTVASRLRGGLRPNIYAESAPDQPLDYSLIDISVPEILSAEG